jgi:hypothetical protein
MEGFFCPLGLLSDRSGNISGNQPIYSAYYYVMGGYPTEKFFSIRNTLIDNFVFHRYIPEYRIRTIRYPDNGKVPDSHDNILAHLYFGSLTADDLEKTGWYINSNLPSDFTWMECFKDIILLIKKHGTNPHRNVWHEEGYRAIAKIANRLPLWLRYYANPIAKYYVPYILHIMISYIKPNFKNGIRETNNVSAKIQCYFMLKSTNSRYLIMLFNIKELCDIYFDEAEHPIRRILNDKM